MWNDRLKNFFQRLAQAVEASKRSCLVVSLLATEPSKNDDMGKGILDACNQGLNRQASVQSPGGEGRPGGTAAPPDVRKVSRESGGPASARDGVLGPDEGD